MNDGSSAATDVAVEGGEKAHRRIEELETENSRLWSLLEKTTEVYVEVTGVSEVIISSDAQRGWTVCREGSGLSDQYLDLSGKWISLPPSVRLVQGFPCFRAALAAWDQVREKEAVNDGP